MSFIHIVKKALVGGVYILMAVAALGFWWVNSHIKEGCDHTLQVAQNLDQVGYLDSWAMNNVVDQGYHFVSGMHGHIMGSRKEEQISIIPLPSFEKSGIDNRYFRFAARKLSGDYKTEFTSENIARFEFGNGRDQVIVLKNGAELESYRGHNESSGHLVKVSDYVFAYCADSTF